MTGLFGAMSGVLADASSIAQGYQTSDTSLVIGMAAALSSESGSAKQAVERASISNKTKYVGIVTTKDANQITLTTQKANVVVTTAGQANAFVTDVGGTIKKGDGLTISPIKGIFMLANNSDTAVYATALEDLGSQSSTSQKIKLANGSEKDAKIASMLVELNAHNIDSGSTNTAKSFLGTLGKSITGKTLSDWQVTVSAIIFILILVVEGSLIYGAVHSTIISLGRNPMSKDAVYKQLFQVVLSALAVLAFGIATIYATLQI